MLKAFVAALVSDHTGHNRRRYSYRSFTPTESGAIACLIAFVAGKFIYKRLKWSDLPSVLANTALVTSAIMIIIAMGNVLGWTLAMTGFRKCFLMEFSVSQAARQLLCF